MNRKLIWKDIVRNKVVSIAIMLFIAAASMLLSLSGILATHLLGSIDQLMQKAKTPHFMQMHSGEANLEQVERFAKEDGRVEKYQALEFLNMASEKSSLAGNPLLEMSRTMDFVRRAGNLIIYWIWTISQFALKTENSMSRSAIIRIRLLRLEIGQ